MPAIPALKAETGEQRVQGQIGLDGEFQASLSYIVRPWFKDKQENKHFSLDYKF